MKPPFFLFLVLLSLPLMSQSRPRVLGVPFGVMPTGTGGIASNGSGDYVVAFSTANQVVGGERIRTIKELANGGVSPLFLATIEATEEAIINSLFAAETMTGNDGHTREALPEGRVLELLRKRGALR